MQQASNSLIHRRYTAHRGAAKQRNIPFLLTFDEWWKLWQDSGKWDQRGWRKGQYCMSRYGDKGAYETGNVRICLSEENRAERNQNYPNVGERNGAYGQNFWLRYTPEQREVHLVASSRGGKQPKSASTRAAMAIAATGRRRVYRDGRRTWAYPGEADYPAGGTF